MKTIRDDTPAVNPRLKEWAERMLAPEPIDPVVRVAVALERLVDLLTSTAGEDGAE